MCQCVEGDAWCVRQESVSMCRGRCVRGVCEGVTQEGVSMCGGSYGGSRAHDDIIVFSSAMKKQ